MQSSLLQRLQLSQRFSSSCSSCSRWRWLSTQNPAQHQQQHQQPLPDLLRDESHYRHHPTCQRSRQLSTSTFASASAAAAPQPHELMTRSAIAAAAAAAAPYDLSIPNQRFPSLIIQAARTRESETTTTDPNHFLSSSTAPSRTTKPPLSTSLIPCGSFAEAQARYMEPDPDAVQALAQLLLDTRTGIVAHYYMDVELQGVLNAVQQHLLKYDSGKQRVGIADSLKMGDLAVDMVRNHDVQQVICLGVDFMAESVHTILHHNTASGGTVTPVYRADARKIGCSLAEAAERLAYRAWLQRESSSSTTTKTTKGDDEEEEKQDRNESQPCNALHVVYINTSLETKAVSASIVPTITCTSSNVLATILQAAIQIPRLKLLYGPDTYMGENLIALLSVLIEQWDDAQIAERLHPNHTVQSLRQLRDSISVFPSGNCVVHHMFGSAVVDTVKRHYNDDNVFVTAHLEVPGEMFDIAMAKSLHDQGVVGSTSDILHFITRKVQQQAAATTTTTAATSTSTTESQPQRLRFILGTEAGMVTSIVRNVQRVLEETGNASIQVEIIFPVSSEAIMSTSSSSSSAADSTTTTTVNGDSSSSSATMSTTPSELPFVPGVGGGEGCSTAGGCATCPYMKMNHLDAVMHVLELIRDDKMQQLQPYLPPDRLRGKRIHGIDAVQLGTQAIAYMRHFLQHQRLPDELVQKVLRQHQHHHDNDNDHHSSNHPPEAQEHAQHQQQQQQSSHDR